MRQIIHDLRKQTAHDRHKMSMFLAVSFSVVMFLIWAGTLHLAPTAMVGSVKNGVAPFSLVKDNIVQVFGAAQKGFESAQESITKTNVSPTDK